MKRISFLMVFALSINMIYALQGDTLDICRENGKVRFASFAVNSNSDRKMSNDIVFLKSILQAKSEDEFCLINEITDELGITRKRFQQYYICLNHDF